MLIPYFTCAQQNDNYVPNSPFNDPIEILDLAEDNNFISSHKIKKITIRKEESFLGESLIQLTYEINGTLDSTIRSIDGIVTGVSVYNNGYRTQEIDLMDGEHYWYTREGITLDSINSSKSYVLRKYKYDTSGFLTKEIITEHSKYQFYDSICYKNDSLGRAVEVLRWKGSAAKQELREYDSNDQIIKRLYKKSSNSGELLWYYRYRSDGLLEMAYFGRSVPESILDLSLITLDDTLELFRLANAFKIYNFNSDDKLDLIIDYSKEHGLRVNRSTLEYESNGHLKNVIQTSISHNKNEIRKSYNWDKHGRLVQYMEYDLTIRLKPLILRKKIEYDSEGRPIEIWTERYHPRSDDFTENTTYITYEYYP